MLQLGLGFKGEYQAHKDDTNLDRNNNNLS
jgi:hypothetical protein